MRKTCVFVCMLSSLALLGPRPAAAQPIYQYQFSEWRQVSVFGNLAAKLVSEPRYEQVGGYLLEQWDLLAPTIFGTPAYLSAVAHSNGHVFWAKAIAPHRGGVAGNTIGGQAFVFVMKEYVKTSDNPLLRFVYSAGDLQVMDFGSGHPPWFSPTAEIEMDVAVLDFESRHQWGIRQSAKVRSDLGISLDDLADDIWVLDLYGELRGEDAKPYAFGPRWRWSCDTCGTAAYGYHRAILDAPYSEAIDLSGVPKYTGFRVWFALKVDALDRGQGETAARAFAKDPVSDDDLTSAGVGIETADLIEIEVPRCEQPGLAGVACLLGALPPARCAGDVLPKTYERATARAKKLLEDALAETSSKKLRSLAKRIRGALKSADRAIVAREKAKRGPKPSPECAADLHGTLQHAMARLTGLACDPATGVLSFVAESYSVSEADGTLAIEVTRSGGSKGKLAATLLPGLDPATPGLDYERPVAPVVFARNEIGSRTISIPIVDDRSGEGDETFVLTLSSPAGCATGHPATTVVTIHDDDWLPPPPTYTVGGTVAGL